MKKLTAAEAAKPQKENGTYRMSPRNPPICCTASRRTLYSRVYGWARSVSIDATMSASGHQRLIDDVRFMSARRNFGHHCVAANVEEGHSPTWSHYKSWTQPRCSKLTTFLMRRKLRRSLVAFRGYRALK